MIEPYYNKDGITLYLGDCRSVLPQLPDKSVDLVLTDPPYGMNKDFNNDKPEIADDLVRLAMLECQRIYKRNIISFWSAQRFNVIHKVFGDYKRIMIWHKEFAIYAPHNVGYRYEPIIWLCGDKANEKRGDVFSGFPIIFRVQEENQNHPTQKPVKIISELIHDFSDIEDIILDPFLGSGTTAVACKKLGRRCIGIEIEEKYLEIAVKRLSQEVMKLD